MTKRGPLAKAEKFYIAKNLNTMDLDTIAKDLDRTVNSIKKYATKVEEEQVPTIGDQFAKNGKGSVVMTENASSMIDVQKKPTKRYRDNCVTKIKPEN